jgi:hypothetical protein
MKTDSATTLTGKARERLANAWRLCNLPSVMKGWWRSSRADINFTTKTAASLTVLFPDPLFYELCEYIQYSPDATAIEHELVDFLPRLHRSTKGRRHWLTPKRSLTLYRVLTETLGVGCTYFEAANELHIIEFWERAEKPEEERAVDVVIPRDPYDWASWVNHERAGSSGQEFTALMKHLGIALNTTCGR